jgi:nucleoid-associated protein YgaU
MQMANQQLSVRLAMLIAAVCAVFLMIGLLGGQAGAEGPTPAPIEYVVQSGDTLWDIAASHSDPGEDIRRVVRDIRKLSETSATIHPGQVLFIPSA